MSTISVDETVNKYLVNAVTRLKSLKFVNVTKSRTSHYNYGTEEPFIRDRFEIELDSKDKSIRCQVVFDSSNYYLPPDVIIKDSVVKQAFDIEDMSVLLPASDWDLKDQDCLYDWFERMISMLKKPPTSPSPPPPPPPSSSSSSLEAAPTRSSSKRRTKNWGIFDILDDSDDDFIISNPKNDNNDDFVPVDSATKKKKRPDMNEKVEKRESTLECEISKKMAETDITAATSIFDLDQMERGDQAPTKKRKLTQGSVKSAAMRLEQENRWSEEFMRLWTRKLSDYALQLDAKDASSVTLYMSFTIDQNSEAWIQYSWDKQASLDEYRTKNGLPSNYKMARPKAVAPMIVHVDLMSTHLKVKLISVINTDKQKSGGADHIDLTYKFNQQKSVGNEMTRIRNDIKKQAIHFHLFQRKAEERSAL